LIELEYNDNKIELKSTKIIAACRNYKAYAKEMNVSLPEKPEFFLKPPSSLIGNNGVIILPGMSNRVDYEVELAVIMKNKCHNISIEEVNENILGYSVFVDVTARDLQSKSRDSGMPWSISKGFDTFAPIGPRIVDKKNIDTSNLNIWLKVNGEYKQRSNTGDMIFSVEELISFISKIMTLQPMDIIATGTPEGVGKINDGDIVEAGIHGIGILKFSAKKEI
jgi:2-keto-4-pentenoate hydratase/2-oxohepta-3-ene-1,7-dioic acid hydratase in catechol pathway